MKNKTKGLAIGTLIIGAMGYLAGILTAPKSGKETRTYLNQARAKGMIEAEKQLKRLHTELNELIGEAEEAGKRTVESFKNQEGHAEDQALHGEIVGRASHARQKAREILSALHEGNADDRDLDKAVVDASKAIKSIRKFLKR